MDETRDEKPVPLAYSPPEPRRPVARRILPYAVFAVCAFLAGLFVSWIPSAGMEYPLYMLLTVLFGLGALVLPFLIQRDFRDFRD